VPPPHATIEEVRLICPTTATDAQVQLCLDMAHVTVGTSLAGTSQSEQTLWAIELQLSAHYVCLIDPRAKDIGDGDTRVSLQRGQDGKGLESTQYGQAAIALDASGTLGSLGTRKRTVITLY
jgi:hypothetical protein